MIGLFPSVRATAARLGGGIKASSQNGLMFSCCIRFQWSLVCLVYLVGHTVWNTATLGEVSEYFMHIDGPCCFQWFLWIEGSKHTIMYSSIDIPIWWRLLTVRMDTSLFTTFLGILLLLVIVYISLVHLLSPEYDPREPPVISSLIPYVGHMIGLLRYGQRYFEILRSPILLAPTKHN